MGWEFYGPLIVKYGIEGAFKIAQVIAEHGDPTPEAWQKLLAIGLKSETQYMLEAAKRAGLPQIPPWVLPPDPVVAQPPVLIIGDPPPAPVQ